MSSVFLKYQVYCTTVSLFLSSQIFAISKPTQQPAQDQTSSQKLTLTREQAINYALKLVNRDRAKFGLKPLSVDPIATAAGQRHADEMAQFGYLSHWDIAGKKPIQRYSECGGTDYASENIGLTATHSPKTQASRSIFRLNPEHIFLSTNLDELENDFMNEKPPNDGHRQQILDPMHNRLGIGVSFSELEGQSRITIAQEFVNHFGEFESFPSTLKRKTTFTVTGTLPKQINLDEVKIEKEPIPQPKTAAQLDNGPRSSVYTGLPILEYFPGKDANLKVWTDHEQTKFSVNVQVDDNWESGLYYISIWAKKRGEKNRILISARTALLE